MNSLDEVAGHFQVLPKVSLVSLLHSMNQTYIDLGVKQSTNPRRVRNSLLHQREGKCPFLDRQKTNREL